MDFGVIRRQMQDFHLSTGRMGRLPPLAMAAVFPLPTPTAAPGSVRSIVKSPACLPLSAFVQMLDCETCLQTSLG
jgi:hypothetical protein